MPAPAKTDVFLKLDTGTHTDDISQVLVSASGLRVITAGECTIRVWDAQSRRPLRMLLGQVQGRSEEVFGWGNVIRMALCPADDRSLVVLKDVAPAPGRRRAQGGGTEVQVFDIETGNLRTRFLHAGAASDLDFSPDGRLLALAGRAARVQVYAAQDVLRAGFERLPQALASKSFQRPAQAAWVRTAVRFVPGRRRKSDPYRLLVATTRRADEFDRDGAGMLHWACFTPATGMHLDRALATPADIDPGVLAVSEEWAVVAAVHTVPQGKLRLGQVLGHAHDDSVRTSLLIESPAASLAFAPTGTRLLAGTRAHPAAAPGADTLPVHAYAVSCLGFELRSSYFGHDHSVTAAAFLADDLAVTSGGDSQSIHFWDSNSQVGQMQAVIRGVGRTVFDAQVDRHQQVVFGTVPDRLLPRQRLQVRRQQTFCLNSLRLGSTEPHRVGRPVLVGRKWVVLDVTGRSLLVPIRYSPTAHGADLDQPTDLTLFVGSDDEWVLWTRSGYYDASPLGARRLGYHVNRGEHQEALFMASDRFKGFHRPDIVRAVVEYGTEERARTLGGLNIEWLDVAQMLPPVVELESVDETHGGNEVVLRFRVHAVGAGEPASRVWILRNDRFAWTAHGPSARGGRYRVRLPLGPGRNVLSIRAENSTGRAPAVEREVWGPKAAPQAPLAFGASGNLYLLSVGVSNFQAAGTPAAEKRNYRALKCAHRDAIAVYNALACSAEGAEMKPSRPLLNRAFDAVHARLLVDGQATKAAIMEALHALCDQIKRRGQAPGAERDVLVIFLAGHGVPVAGDPELYFLNFDALLDDLEETGVAFLEVGEVIATVPAEVVILIDTCHSGMAGAGVDRGVGPDEVARRLQQVSERGMYVLSAARAEELAREGGAQGHGVFTEALLATLKSRRYVRPDPDGKTESLNMASLMAGLQAEMPRITARLAKPPQTPVFRLFGDLLPLTILRR